MTTEPSRPVVASPLAAVSPALTPRTPPLAVATPRENHDAAAEQTDAEMQWQIDFAWKVFEQNQELIRATDQKVYNLIVMSTLLISLSSANIERFVPRAGAREVALGFLVVSCVNFFVHALTTLFARASKSHASHAKSLIFFGHIAARDSVDTFKSQFVQAGREALLDDLLSQVSIVSVILQKKLANYRRSWIAAAFEVLVFLSMVLVGHFL